MRLTQMHPSQRPGRRRGDLESVALDVESGWSTVFRPVARTAVEDEGRCLAH